MDALDRALIAATQDGLPMMPQPYAEVACRIGTSEAEVVDRMQRMLASGAIRRLGAIPNHYALGYRANGMTVWDVDDVRIAELGPRVGALAFVTHCYRRPRHLPQWPYNLFAMVHGRTRAEVEAHALEISALLGSACNGHDVLYSTRVLKKTGLRLAA
jgi:DNA-binding Lrp family transcriptional regulator